MVRWRTTAWNGHHCFDCFLSGSHSPGPDVRITHEQTDPCFHKTSSKTGCLNIFSMLADHPGSLLKFKLRSSNLGRGSRFCISRKLPGAAAASGRILCIARLSSHILRVLSSSTYSLISYWKDTAFGACAQGHTVFPPTPATAPLLAPRSGPTLISVLCQETKLGFGTMKCIKAGRAWV